VASIYFTRAGTLRSAEAETAAAAGAFNAPEPGGMAGSETPS
jgi:hypothetical protein